MKDALTWRELEHCFISVDDFDCDPDDPDADEPDAPVIVVDVKVRGALYTFWYNTDSREYNHSILGEDVVNRYLAISKGHQPELPGIYTYPSEECS